LDSSFVRTCRASAKKQGNSFFNYNYQYHWKGNYCC